MPHLMDAHVWLVFNRIDHTVKFKEYTNQQISEICHVSSDDRDSVFAPQFLLRPFILDKGQNTWILRLPKILCFVELDHFYMYYEDLEIGIPDLDSNEDGCVVLTDFLDRLTRARDMADVVDIVMDTAISHLRDMVYNLDVDSAKGKVELIPLEEKAHQFSSLVTLYLDILEKAGKSALGRNILEAKLQQMQSTMKEKLLRIKLANKKCDLILARNQRLIFLLTSITGLVSWLGAFTLVKIASEDWQIFFLVWGLLAWSSLVVGGLYNCGLLAWLSFGGRLFNWGIGHLFHGANLMITQMYDHLREFCSERPETNTSEDTTEDETAALATY